MKQDDQMDKIRHSLSHLMSMAIMELYPKTGLGVGPFIENGFYQDYDLPESISSEIFPKLEKRIKQFIKQGIKFEQHAMNFNDALKLYQGDPYKTELIEDLKKAGEKDVSFYKSDWFENLCKGPHVKSTQEINADAFKLTKIAGAYWRGNEKNKMLTRIYGVAFAAKKELDDYLTMMAEAEKRDHRKLGKELDLFYIDERVGKGLPLFAPKGAIIRQILERWVEDEERKRGYQKTYTSSLGSKQLYEISGHWAHYKDDMFITEADESPYALRPMTCPHQFCIFQAKPRSYKELPIRYSETSTLFRNELSGELSGLIRVRQFTISEGHLICRADQVEEEILGVLNLIEYILKTLGLNNYTYRFSKWDRENKKGKYVNNPEAWNKTQESMKKILDKAGVEYTEADGEAAFYGPKLDVQYKNVNGKEDTIITVQVDFAMSGRFGLKYTDSNGKEAEPVVIHRTSLGCYERTLAYLIEHYAGAFPVWLSPVQVKLVAVSAKHVEYCTKQAQELMGAGIRVEVDFSDETMGNKIRKAVAEKVPYMLVIGDREMESEKLNVRDRGAEDIREIGKDEFIKEILEKINSKL